MTVEIMVATLMSIQMFIVPNTGLLLLETVLDINGSHVIYYQSLIWSLNCAMSARHGLIKNQQFHWT